MPVPSRLSTTTVPRWSARKTRSPGYAPSSTGRSKVRPPRAGSSATSRGLAGGAGGVGVGVAAGVGTLVAVGVGWSKGLAVAVGAGGNWKGGAGGVGEGVAAWVEVAVEVGAPVAVGVDWSKGVAIAVGVGVGPLWVQAAPSTRAVERRAASLGNMPERGYPTRRPGARAQKDVAWERSTVLGPRHWLEKGPRRFR